MATQKFGHTLRTGNAGETCPMCRDSVEGRPVVDLKFPGERFWRRGYSAACAVVAEEAAKVLLSN